jgi:predicted nuclease of predicted toxin-antitoxin system
MKLLLDQGLPRSAVRYMTGAISAEHAGDLGLSAASDQEILQKAREHQAVLVTLDADFHQILALTQATSPSVIRVRIDGLRGEQLAALLNRAVSTVKIELTAGAAVSVSPARIRVRSLPIN